MTEATAGTAGTEATADAEEIMSAASSAVPPSSRHRQRHRSRHRRRLASEGAHVVCGDVDDARGKAAADEVGGIFVKVDVTDPEQVEALFKTAFDTYGSVDIAFNNAGISPPDDDSILETGLEAWKRVQEVNLTSVYLCCKAAIPYMRRQGKGSIINTASFVARMGAATSQISYTASKGGVLAMSRELGVQFAPARASASTPCARDRSTPRCSRNCSPRTPSGPHADSSTSPWPVRRPRGIAAAVAFLASDDSSLVNTDFLVDRECRARTSHPVDRPGVCTFHAMPDSVRVTSRGPWSRPPPWRPRHPPPPAPVPTARGFPRVVGDDRAHLQQVIDERGACRADPGGPPGRRLRLGQHRHQERRHRRHPRLGPGTRQDPAPRTGGTPAGGSRTRRTGH